MARITRHPRLIIASSLTLAALALIGLYAFVAAAQPRPLTGQIALDAGPNGQTCGTDAFVIELAGGGTLAHLGSVEVTAMNCTGWLGEPLGSPASIYDGTATYTAADGSTLLVNYEGEQSVPTAGIATFEVTQVVTSGTGRFAGATGEWQVTGTVDLNVGLLRGDVDGWLRY